MQVLLVSPENTGLQLGAGKYVQYFMRYKVLLFYVSHFLGESFLLNVTLPV